MKNTTKGILLAVGAIIICVVATIAFILVSGSRNTANRNDATDGSEDLVEVSKRVYDKSVVTGSEVISAIDKYSTDSEVAIRVLHKNGSIDLYGTVGLSYYANEIDRINGTETVIKSVTSSNYDNTVDSNSNLYINPGTTFASTVRYNNDDKIVLITFGQEGSNKALEDYRHDAPLDPSDDDYNDGAGAGDYAKPDSGNTGGTSNGGTSNGGTSNGGTGAGTTAKPGTTESTGVKSYNIKYELNGGTLDKEISSYTENDEIELPEPTKDGSDFIGWYTEDTFINKVTKIEKGSTGDRTFYAKWGTLTAFAVYSEDGYTLKFYKRESVPKVGTSFDGATVTKVYKNIELLEATYNGAVLWSSYCAKIKSVDVVDKIKPISTAYWFYSFSYCTEFNLANLDTSNSTSMAYMFYQAAKYSTSSKIIGIEKWNTSNVSNMEYMFWRGFQKVSSFKIDISEWDTGKVTDMSYMFYETGNNATEWSVGSLNNWKVSNVTNMTYMFYRAGYSATSIDINMANWNTSKVTNMQWMFYETGRSAQEFNINVTNWKTDNVTSMKYMFYCAGYSATTWSIGDLGDWNVYRVTSMYYMFNYAGYSATVWNIGNLDKWNTSNVIDMSYMFSYAGYKCTTGELEGLEFWNVSNVTGMSQMFYSCRAARTTKLYLTGWNTAKVTSYSNFNTFAVGITAPSF